MDDASSQDRDRFHSPEFGRALGRTIKVMRTEQGFGRRELAERAGISYSYVTEIENGDKPASSKVLAMIAGALGMRLHELIAAAETRAARFELEREAREYPSPSPAARWGEAIAPPSARSPERRVRAQQSPPLLPGFSLSMDPTMERDPSYPSPGYSSDSYAGSSYAPRTPRSLGAVMSELQALLPHMEPDDVERVLDFARRLAR